MSGTPEEAALWQGRPSWWTWWPQLAIGDLLILLAAALWWAGHGAYAPAAGAGAALFYAIVLAGRQGVLYTLTTERVIARSGLLSRRIDEVEIRDIRNIVLEQTFIQRLTRTGDVGIASAGGDGVEVRFDGIPDAAAVKERIRRARLDAGGSDAD